MRVPVKLSIFAAGLVVLFGGAFAIGSVSGFPVAEDQPSAHEPGGGDRGDEDVEHEEDGQQEAGHGEDGQQEAGHDGSGQEAGHGGSEPGAGHDAPAETPGGVLMAEGGYRLDSLSVPDTTGEVGSLTFRVLDAHGDPVTEYTAQHERDLHLIVVSQDTNEFRHVHPTLGADGTWSIDWTWNAAGSYRVYADFLPAAAEAGLTLAQDVTVPGAVTVEPLPEPSHTDTVDAPTARSSTGAPYTVTLTGHLTTDGGPLTFEIAQDGRPVTDLDPYLGAYGHLVALRVGDLAYLHTHPEGEMDENEPGPAVEFVSTAPSPGTYRLFLDFSHDGVVHTADFTVEVTE
ncbi:hypothetical protein EXU48_14965 [Occultella glacieicola]|uniref:Heavy metal-binding domain-containing protein n=1 Tax=Occultella glacieicola TaxID=2518684 RepID=A0ABY2E0V6_9MICO|nr:hypothetical protein [Occultella glacieicola]TDE91462.1 hypothetical protein EXU48_14965 [Occultella glacieicola]